MRAVILKSARRSILLCGFACALTFGACVKLPRHAALAGDKASPEILQSVDESPRVSINRASREELQKLPGIGPALAARIVEHRERYGPFRRAEHLIMVRGISERRFRQMRALIRTE